MMKSFVHPLAVALFFFALAARAAATDDMQIYSGRFNNGWGDSWSWMPRYATNNPVFTSSSVYVASNSMACVPDGNYQAWWLKAGTTVDTTIYASLSFWIHGGATGGQTISVQGELNGSKSGLPSVQVTAPTNSWKQVTISLSSLGVDNKSDLTGFQIGNQTSTQPFFIDDMRLMAAPAPATVHVNVNASQTVRTVSPRVFGINEVAWDGSVNSAASVSILTNIGATCLRWPGGSWGDGYHWTNENWSTGNSGPRYWGSFSPDFIALATNAHCNAFIIANYGTSDANEAAYGVRMFNLTNHCNFKYWEIGNEVGGSWEWDWPYPGFATNDILDLSSLADRLYTPTNNISTYLRSQLSAGTLSALTNYMGNPSGNDAALRWALVNDINNLMYNGSQSVYFGDTNRFAGITFRSITLTNLSLPIPALGQDLANRMTLEDAFPELAKLTPAINLASNWPNVYLPHDAWTYAMRFKDYYTQMKAADPTIKIGAVVDITEDGTSNYGNHPVVNPRTGVTHNGWTPVMLTYMRSNNCIPDFVIEHSYGPTAGDTQDLLWPRGLATDAVSLRQMLTDYLGAAATNVALEVTENGMGGDKQSVSLPGGLFYADSFGQILQTEFDSRIWWDMHNGAGTIADPDPAFYGWRKDGNGNYISDGGIVNGDGVGANGYPTYYAAKLLTHFAKGGDTVVSASSDYPLLATYAVQRTNGTLTLLVINKSSSSDLTANFAVSGYLPSTNATIYSYGIPQDEAARTGIGSTDIETNTVSFQTSSLTFAPFSMSVVALSPGNGPPQVPANVVATGSNTTVALTWSASGGATSYIIKRSTTSGSGYVPLATGVTATGYLDTGLVNGTTYYYVVAATNSYGASADSAEAAATPMMKLTGTVIGSPGSWSNLGNTITNVFDGNTNTFYDAANGTGDWAGIDLGSGTNGVVMQIKYWPRASSGSRMVGGQFQGANVADFSSGVVTLFTVSSAPPDGMNVQTVTDTNTFRYLRYIGPANGWCNVAEVEFWGANAVVPPAPTNLAATIGDASVALSWSVSPNATSYHVKRSNVSSNFTTIATNLSLTFTNGGLTNGTLYYFVVSALKAYGESTNSAPVSARPTSSAPVAMSATNYVAGQFRIAWPADHTGWMLQAQTNSLDAGLGTNWVNVPNSDQTNQMPVPVSATNGAVFFRLAHP